MTSVIEIFAWDNSNSEIPGYEGKELTANDNVHRYVYYWGEGEGTGRNRYKWPCKPGC